MLFYAEFKMLPGIQYEIVNSKILSWEKEMESNTMGFKILGKYGFYGARRGFFIIETDDTDNFYTCIKHFKDVYVWNLKPIHPLADERFCKI
ncbi:MAG: hypothetical protein HY096_14160 [Nitrospinae bacterium]|nr:hypothetical protein [Nitrospinota bacterium]